MYDAFVLLGLLVNGHIVVQDCLDNLLPDGAQSSGAPRSSVSDRSSNAGFGPGIDVYYGQTPQTGLPYSESIALTSATAYACSRARAETLATLPSIVYEQVTRRSRERARGSDPWRLLYDDPNPFMDSTCFYELLNMRQVNRGNGFAEIERDNADNPIYLWPIHPSRVIARSEYDGSGRWRLYWDVMTDVRDPLTGNAVFHRVEDRNMLNVCGFGGNGIIAPGVIDMGREEIALELATRRYGSTFFKNGGKPTAVVEMPQYIDDDDQRREFRADMNSVLKSENWHEVPVLWNGAKWRDVQVSPEQAQFLETRGFSARQVCRMWNVVPAIVQIFDDYKVNTVDAMIMQFVMTAVRPDAIRVERAINRKVLAYRDERGRLRNAFDGEYFLEFLLEGLLRGDAKKQAETFEIKRRNGIMNANEWREKDNDNPIGEQGEKFVLPGGFGDLATLGALPDVSPANSNGGSDNASASGQPLPEFSRERVIEAVDRAIGPRRNIARGASLQSASSRERALIKSMALNQLTEAVERIEAILTNEQERLAAKGQQLTKINWDRHQARLESALLPGCKSYAMASRKIDAALMANILAINLVSVRRDDGLVGKNMTLSKLAAVAAKRGTNHGRQEEDA